VKVKTLKVSEIFYSLQGESSYAGRPCAFVRLTGCNLRCAYCDTRYAYTGGTELGIEAVLERLVGYGCGLVEITGGEPLMQDATPSLAKACIEAGLVVLVETNGSLDIDRMPGGCVRIVDMKCPSSRESQRMDFDNLRRLSAQDELKFVLADREDYDYAKALLERLPAQGSGRQIHFSPVHGVLAPRELACWILQDRLQQVRLHLQLHKLVWGAEQRGV